MDKWKAQVGAALAALALSALLAPALPSSSQAESYADNGKPAENGKASDANEKVDATVYSGRARHNTGVRPWRNKPDFELRENVEGELSSSSLVDAEDIEVSVKKGTVTLKGMVENQRALETAVESARKAGAKTIISMLKIRNEEYPTAYGGQSRHNTGVRPWRKKSDDELKDNVKNALASRPDGKGIEVSVKKGTVTLKGMVENQQALETAIESVREAGARKIISMLKIRDEEYATAYGGQSRHNTGVRPWRKKSDDELKDNVKNELASSPLVDAEDIEVSVKKGTVTLKGVVENRRSLETAIESAREAGAKEVISMLKTEEEE
jgi:osmotically-inducible protein OsmY